MSEIRFRSDISVTLADHCGSDSAVARGAWVVPPHAPEKRDTAEGVARVVGACVKGRHNTPFERGLLEVYAEMPGVVWWQLTRHRFMSLGSEDFAFNMESSRYRHLDPEFYVPPLDRPLVEGDGFKPMRPRLESALEVAEAVRENMSTAFRAAWGLYSNLVVHKVAREVARLVLPNWAIYCDGYVSAKPLTWLQFFSKRAKTGDTAVPTFPQYEIEKFCEACEKLFSALWPGVYAAFVANGRVAPS